MWTVLAISGIVGGLSVVPLITYDFIKTLFATKVTAVAAAAASKSFVIGLAVGSGAALLMVGVIIGMYWWLTNGVNETQEGVQLHTKVDC